MAEYDQDFQEVAHCGGQATFNVHCDADGRRSVAAGFRHSRPTPAAWVGIYATIADGTPVADFQIGGIGQGFEPSCPTECLPVFVGSDSHQKWPHQCPRCKSYFRSGTHSPHFPFTCPYCGLKGAAYKFLTDGQRRYVQHYITTFLDGFEQEMPPNSNREILIDMDAVVNAGTHAERPTFYYAAEAQQTRFTCEKCGDFNDIRGVFGYCTSCSWRNNLPSFKVAVAEMRTRLNAGTGPAETVRAAVSQFDSCCRNMVAQLVARIAMKPSRRADLERLIFHDIESPKIALLKSAFDVDFGAVSPPTI